MAILASVFCALRPHDDLALKHAATFLIEHGFEHFAAGASPRDVLGDQRGIGVLPTPHQTGTANARNRLLSRKAARIVGYG